MAPRGYPSGAAVKNLSANAEDVRDSGLTSGSGRSPGEGNGNSLQYPCLGNPMDRRAWQVIAQRVAELDTPEHTQADATQPEGSFLPCHSVLDGGVTQSAGAL